MPLLRANSPRSLEHPLVLTWTGYAPGMGRGEIQGTAHVFSQNRIWQPVVKTRIRAKSPEKAFFLGHIMIIGHHGVASITIEIKGIAGNDRNTDDAT